MTTNPNVDGENLPNNINSSDNSTLENATPLTPKQRVEDIFEKVEMMALRQGASSNINLNSFNDDQKQEFLKLVKANEDHAFEYFIKKLESKERVKIAQINAGSYEFKTSRITSVIISLALLLVTVLVLIYKNDLFVPWLTFIGGLIGGGFGGYGYGKSKGMQQTSNTSKE